MPLKILDTEIFILLKRQAMESFIFLLATRRFAIESGIQKEVDRINTELEENVRILTLINKQLSDLNTHSVKRIGFFGSVSKVA